MMLKDENLFLPPNWEAILEQMMLERSALSGRRRIYICSPCRADTPDGVYQNMKAVRVYMFYVYLYFNGMPIAPHAYLPVLLSDDREEERALALFFGEKMLYRCSELFVCGDRLSAGMYSEIKAAIKLGIPIKVFHREIYEELQMILSYDGVRPNELHYENSYLQSALEWNAKQLALHWGDSK